MSHSNASRNDGRSSSVWAKRLGERLVTMGVVTADQVEIALQQQHESPSPKPLGQILIENGFASSDEVTEVLAEFAGIPFLRINAELVQEAAVRCLPIEFLDRYNILPISLTDTLVTIALERFNDVFLIEDIGRRTFRDVHVVAATPESIRNIRASLIRKLGITSAPENRIDPSSSTDGLRDILAQIDVNELRVVEQAQQFENADLIANASNSPVIKLVNYIIKTGVEMRASDIHIEPDDPKLRVRFRVDGELLDSVRPSAQLLPAVVSRIKIMAEMDISERRLPQDGGMTVKLGNRSIDVRVSTMPTKLGEKVVLRIADRTATIRRIDALGLMPSMAIQFSSAIDSPFGLVLVTGPTGSGKTTTLYAALSEIAASKYNISTVEDPVEVRLHGTNQSQIQPQVGFTFARALRSLLRQDPDVIMVGEIRDLETATLATEAALTGHLVLSTLHTNDAATAVPRLINMGVEPYLVAASLRCALAQRLIRKLCSHCRQTSPLSAIEQALMARIYDGACPIDVAYITQGCAQCCGLGYMGRIGIFEVLMLDEQMLTAVARDSTTQSFREIIRQQRIPSFLDDGLEKVRMGLISAAGLLEVVSRVTQSDDNDAGAVPEAA